MMVPENTYLLGLQSAVPKFDRDHKWQVIKEINVMFSDYILSITEASFVQKTWNNYFYLCDMSSQFTYNVIFYKLQIVYIYLASLNISVTSTIKYEDLQTRCLDGEQFVLGPKYRRDFELHIVPVRKKT